MGQRTRHDAGSLSCQTGSCLKAVVGVETEQCRNKGKDETMSDQLRKEACSSAA